jgi:hypothetical protein
MPTQPPTQGMARAVSPGVKRQGREADEVKNGGAIPPLPKCLKGVVLN